MPRSHLAFTLLLSMACFLLPIAWARVTIEEAAALEAVGTAFGYPWVGAVDLQNVCQTVGDQPGIPVIKCASYGAEGIHISSLSHPTTHSSAVTSYPEAVKGLVYLRELSIQQDAGSMFNFTAIERLTNLTKLTILTYVAAPVVLDFHSFANLESLTLYYGFNSVLPSLAGLSRLTDLVLRIGSYSSTTMTAPSDIFDGLTSLTNLLIRTRQDALGLASIPSLSHCSLLYDISLSGNNFDYAGLVATNYSKLTQLQVASFSYNARLSKLPETLSGASLLSVLFAHFCTLNQSDSLPDLRYTNVISYVLDYNFISVLPDGICMLPLHTDTNITLGLSNNPITSLPACIGTSKIAILRLAETKMSTFPSTIFNNWLQALEWNNNDQPMTLNGAWNVANWKPNLEGLTLENTRIIAPFPSALKGSLNLDFINLNGNHFQGGIDDDFFLGSAVEHFMIAGSGVSGTFPSSVSAASRLEQILASDNKFTALPDSIGSSTSLLILDLSDNDLVQIPADSIWHSFTSLRTLRIGGNPRLTGPLHTAWFTVLKEELNASYCGFTGDFPSINSSTLYSIFISGNALDGTIKDPTKVGNLYNLYMDQNLLEGPIPELFGNSSNPDLDWSRLAYFNISFNRLTGTLPRTLGNFRDLMQFAINNNGIQGGLLDFYDLTRLKVFEGHNNFLNVCLSDPHFDRTDVRIWTCSVTGNLVRGACSCPQYFEGSCQADACPSPDYVPTTAAPLGSAPTPIKPGSPSPSPQIVGGQPPTGAASSMCTLTLQSAFLLLVALVAIH